MPKRKNTTDNKLWAKSVQNADCQTIIKLIKITPVILKQNFFMNQIHSPKILKCLFIEFQYQKKIKPNFVCEKSILESIYNYKTIEDFTSLCCNEVTHNHTKLDQCILFGDIYNINTWKSNMRCNEWNCLLIKNFIYEKIMDKIQTLLFLYDDLKLIVIEYLWNYKDLSDYLQKQ
jgi:hypothetical protein